MAPSDPTEAQPDSEPRAATRRPPLQSRSFQTVMRIVDAASLLLGYTPLEDLTTSLIAASAGVSIGALYRFFPDKQSIVDAVASRHMGDFRNLLQLTVMPIIEEQFQDLASFDPTLLLDRVIDSYVAYLLEHPDFRAISFGRHISAATREREASPQTGLPSVLKNFMLERLGIPNTPELDLKLRVVSEAGERLIAYAFEQPTEDERNRIVAEMKTMLAAYLFGSDAH